jgi:hypothetical protein
MATDLNNWTLPFQRGGVNELFDATNAWPSASARIYVDVNKTPNGVYQTGYDPVSGRNWMRYKAYEDAAAWTAWKTFDGGAAADAPLPIAARTVLTVPVVDVAFSLLLDPTSTPATTAFVVTGKTVTAVVVAPPGLPNICRLTLNSALPAGGSPTVSYTKPAPPTLKSTDAVDVATFASFAITGT